MDRTQALRGAGGKVGWAGLRWAVSAVALGVVGWQVVTHRAWEGMGHVAWNGWALVGLVGLAPVNWGLEWAKWGVVSRPWRGWAAVRKGGWDRARECLIGGAAGFVTPNRVGDMAGRLMGVPAAEREEAARGYLAGAAAQGWVTLAVGSFFLAAQPSPWAAFAGGVGSLAALGLLAAYLRWSPTPGRWQAVWERLVGPRQAGSTAIQPRQRQLALGLSALRYTAFSAQFLLAFSAVGLAWEAERALAVPLVWLGNMFAPGALLGELGVREAWTWAILQPEGAAVGPTLLAPFLVWGVNLALPAAVGAIWAMRAPAR